MARNTKTLQKQAAHMLIEGYVDSEIVEALKIRPDTLLRWREHPVFIAQLQRLKRIYHHDLSMDLTSMIRETTRNIIAQLRVGCHNETYKNVADLLKLIGKERILPDGMAVIYPDYDKTMRKKASSTCTETSSTCTQNPQNSDETAPQGGSATRL